MTNRLMPLINFLSTNVCSNIIPSNKRNLKLFCWDGEWIIPSISNDQKREKQFFSKFPVDGFESLPSPKIQKIEPQLRNGGYGGAIRSHLDSSGGLLLLQSFDSEVLS
jgi:hypothetical protein